MFTQAESPKLLTSYAQYFTLETPCVPLGVKCTEKSLSLIVNVRPCLNLPDVVTVPDNVNPFTDPVVPTDVTVPVVVDYPYDSTLS